MEFKESFTILEEGTEYSLPQYNVVEGSGLVKSEDELTLKFVRGSKSGEDKVEPREGTLHEHLLSCMIHDLKFKNNLVHSRETALTITKLEEALHWMRARQIDRQKRGVQGTYKK